MWTRRTGSTASVRRDSSPRTVTLRWTSAAAALVSTAPAGTTSTGAFQPHAAFQHSHELLFVLGIIDGDTCSRSYRCDCEPGWVGKNCDLDRNDCLPSPCQNAGTCIDQLNGFTCKCRQGFRGETGGKQLPAVVAVPPRCVGLRTTSGILKSRLFLRQGTSARSTSTSAPPAPVSTKAPVWTVWQVSPVCASSPTADPRALKSSPPAPPTRVPTRPSARTHRTTWATSATVSRGGKVRKSASRGQLSRCD